MYCGPTRARLRARVMPYRTVTARFKCPHVSCVQLGAVGMAAAAVTSVAVAEVAPVAIMEPHLRALAAVCGPAAPRLGREALTGVRHAERAVNKHLHLCGRLRGCLGDLVHREFPPEHNPRTAQPASELGTLPCACSQCSRCEHAYGPRAAGPPGRPPTVRADLVLLAVLTCYTYGSRPPP